MIPSSKWLPTSLQARAAWFANFAKMFATLAAGLGFTPADVAAVEADNDAFQFLASSAVEIDAFDKGMTAYRKLVTEGDNGQPAASLPNPPTWTTPPTALPGIFERLDDLVKRIRVAPTYSEEEGSQLGIVPTKGDSISPDDMQPVLKAKAMPGNIVEVEFVRGKSDGILVQTKLDKEENWSDAGRFFKAPVSLSISTNGTGLPRAVQLRGRYLQGNNPVGLFSDTVNIVTTP